MRVNMIENLDPRYSFDHLGFLTEILDASDPRPLAEQLAERYAHGGGYSPSKDGKWRLVSRDNFYLRYPGDPVYKPSHKLMFPKTKDNAADYMVHPVITHFMMPPGSPDGVVS